MTPEQSKYTPHELAAVSRIDLGFNLNRPRIHGRLREYFNLCVVRIHQRRWWRGRSYTDEPAGWRAH